MKDRVLKPQDPVGPTARHLLLELMSPHQCLLPTGLRKQTFSFKSQKRKRKKREREEVNYTPKPCPCCGSAPDAVTLL